jgi:predicted RNA-binding Zn ribbon-like protein
MATVRQAPGALRLVQEFVNTLEVESGRDELARTWALAEWLRERGLLAQDAEVDEGARVLAVEVREALRLLLLANGGGELDPAAADTLDRARAATCLALRFGPGGAAILEPAHGGVGGALARILTAVYTSMLEGSWPRLKACRNEGCRWAFYDGSKNRSAAWCTMAVCGSRAKARTYRARRGQARRG